MRGGSALPGFFSFSSSRSGTTSGLSMTGLMPPNTKWRSLHMVSGVCLAISPMTSEGMDCSCSFHDLATVRYTAWNQVLLASIDGNPLPINQQCVAALHNQQYS
jgi:hypothetical protein